VDSMAAILAAARPAGHSRPVSGRPGRSAAAARLDLAPC
jgi:hypothetical protein